MPFRFSYIAAVFAAAGVSGGSAAAQDLENTIYLDVDGGRVTIEMRPDVAPMHVARIKELTRQGFYDGLTFHRVIDGFMAQTGDPRGDGTGGSGQNITAEFNQMPFERGVVGMARSQNPNSGDSQFFIMFEAAPHLDRQYTVFGKVVEGMEFVDKIKRGDQNNNGAVTDPDKIISFKSL